MINVGWYVEVSISLSFLYHVMILVHMHGDVSEFIPMSFYVICQREYLSSHERDLIS